jgi:hypothetical protein
MGRIARLPEEEGSFKRATALLLFCGKAVASGQGLGISVRPRSGADAAKPQERGSTREPGFLSCQTSNEGSQAKRGTWLLS